jgi:hypothetical protein
MPEDLPGRPSDAEASSRRGTSEQGYRIINTQEARVLLAMEGIIPPEWVSGTERVERKYDVRTWGRSYRTYRDGRKIALP